MHARLLRAYRETSYEVGGGTVVRIGRRSAMMDATLLTCRLREAVFITAYNPFSKRMPPGWNRRMQLNLRNAIRCPLVLAASGTWRRWSEGHLVVLGDPRPTYRLGRRFRQNSVVLVRLRQPATLQAL